MNALVWWVMALVSRFGKKLHVIALQTVRVEDVFHNDDLILDLGGGGEGVIGRLRGRQVVAVDIRKGELEDAAPGPIKVVADARSLPFPDRSFEAVTAFFFLMYVTAADRPQVLAEAHRVLVPGGSLHVWDVAIATPGARAAKTFAVPICARLPNRTVRTAYGVPWVGREMSSDGIVQLARDAGFAIAAATRSGQTFHLILTRPAE